MTVYAYAKINLFLEVMEKMKDGYHQLESIMQSVTLHDTLKIRKTASGTALKCSETALNSEDNIIIKAAKAFFEKTGIKGGAEIELKKRIPVASGLGGGSADAAATLTALNSLYGAPVSTDELFLLGKSIGADVPFCIFPNVLF